MIRRPPRSTLFPYTRSSDLAKYDKRLNANGAPDGAPFGCQLRPDSVRSEEHTSELQSRPHLVCRLLLEKKKTAARVQRPSADLAAHFCSAHIPCTQYRLGSI